MSTFFSIDDDELDTEFDDEEFLLAACGIPTSSSAKSSSSAGLCNTISTDIPSKNLGNNIINPSKPTNLERSRDTTETSFAFERNKDITGINTARRPLGALANGMFQKQGTNLPSTSTSNRQSPCTEPPPKRFAAPHNNISCQFQASSNIDKNNEKEYLHRPTMPVGYKDSNMTARSITNDRPWTPSSIDNSRHESYPKTPVSQFAVKSNQGYLHSPNNSGKTNTSLRHFGQRNLMESPAQSPSTSSSTSTPVRVRDVTTPSRSQSARKFPGPAGMLPKLSPGQSLDETIASPITSVPFRKSPPVVQTRNLTSTAEDDDFNRDPWICMYKEFKENVSEMMRYTVTKVLAEAAEQRLQHGKVPCLCVLVKAFSLTGADASILLKDTTGEIHGTLHRKVLEEYQTELGTGAGLILKQVTVFSPTPRKHYLNITPGNIIRFYPPDPSHISCSQPLASQMTQEKQKQKSIVIDDDLCTQELFPEAEARQDEPVDPIDNTQETFDELLEGLDEDDLFDDALLAM